MIKKFGIIMGVVFLVSIVSGFAIYNTVADDVQSKLENQNDI